MTGIALNKIKIYEFPDTSEDDEEYKLNKSLQNRVPFAVVGSNAVVEIDGKKLRGRKYPWVSRKQRISNIVIPLL